MFRVSSDPQKNRLYITMAGHLKAPATRMKAWTASKRPTGDWMPCGPG